MQTQVCEITIENGESSGQEKLLYYIYIYIYVKV